jgi:hypothetical protein
MLQHYRSVNAVHTPLHSRLDIAFLLLKALRFADLAAFDPMAANITLSSISIFFSNAQILFKLAKKLILFSDL